MTGYNLEIKRVAQKQQKMWKAFVCLHPFTLLPLNHSTTYVACLPEDERNHHVIDPHYTRVQQFDPPKQLGIYIYTV